MNFDDAVNNYSTKLVLKRFASAYVVDHRNLDDEELIPALIKTGPQYFYQGNVEKTLERFYSHSERKTRLLSSILIRELLLNQDDFLLATKDLLRAMVSYQNSVIDESNEQPKKYKGRVAENHNLFEFVVKTAWDNNDGISPDEKNLIDKIRKKLKISERTYFIIEARLKNFPKPGNEIYTLDDINDILRELHLAGIAIETRDEKGVDYTVIPSEIAATIRSYYGIEIKQHGYRELLNYKSVRRKEYLKEILTDNGYLTGKNETVNQLQELIAESIPPSSLLGGLTPRGGLSVEELKDWCEIRNQPLSGSKAELISRIISSYDSIRIFTPSSEDTREIWHQNFQELACRDIPYLRAQHLIQKDSEIERHFEEATNYLFEIILGHKPLSLIGSKHEDGRLSLGEGLLLWDNKSSENPVRLGSHMQQFDGYIESSERKIEGFLVIAPSFTEDSAADAMSYFVKKQIMITLITATELKAVAETFREKKDGRPFPLRYLVQIGRFNPSLITYS